MAAPRLQTLPYLSDSRPYFEALRDLPLPVWLDSGNRRDYSARYDILSAAPVRSLITTASGTQIRHGQQLEYSNANPFDLVDSALAEINVDWESELPFCGGALGFFGYNLAPCAEQGLAASRGELGFPDMAIGIYEWAIIQDHQERCSWLVALPGYDAAKFSDLLARFSGACEPKSRSAIDFKINGLRSNLDTNSYTEKLSRILDYIAAGDCYQVNFAQRFSAGFEGDSFAAYCHLRELLPAPYSAYMEVPGGAVLSHSPEQFLKVDKGLVTTRPIKGTAPRFFDAVQDQASAAALQSSEKDRAENLMIVDLLRNDLGKACRPGSITVPELFTLESYTNVHHLVSAVSGELRDDCSILQLLKGCFPGGSITGAPKRRATEIIAELEQCDRSVYCGSIGYISAHRKMDSNIAIRSLVLSGDEIHCWGGGGIVADSQAESEYAESLTKVQILLDGLRGA